MDFWARLIGSALPPKSRTTTRHTTANDPRARLARFRRVYNHILDLCNRPRNIQNELPFLENLHSSLERLAALLREESRAPVPHTCLQFAGGNQIYATIARAATISHYEPVIKSAIAVFAALVDSEEEEFLASGHFAKSLMRLIQKVVDSGNVLISTDTETSVLELLFTIAAKIRLQPEILPVWFQSTVVKEDVFTSEMEKKGGFVGITQKDDFPLCYLLIDRVHHEGRIGDFARTGLLYVFEATGRSLDLEEWIVSSDLPTLMASGLGALYSQLSRELSILHPDATLPAVLAMSDYTTTHPRATAVSAFSEMYQAHMATFLSYLAFWQDVLDHSRSADVKQTLLDHFQILFLQQLLYPSLLQSSDTDAGSSVAVSTYMTAMLEALEYPDLINMILKYLMAIEDDQHHLTVPSPPETPTMSPGPPRSPTSVRRRQSLMLLNAPKDPDDAVDPNLFNLVDLIINNVSSQNSQTVFAALKLTSTIFTRHKRYAFGTLLKVQKTNPSRPIRTVGALEKELEQYSELAVSLHRQYDVNANYERLCEDLRYSIEAQDPFKPAPVSGRDPGEPDVGGYLLSDDDPLMRTVKALLRSFFTNSVDVNLALTHAIVSIAQCSELRLDSWLALSASSDRFVDEAVDSSRPWQTYLDQDEQLTWAALKRANRIPVWPDNEAPMMHRELRALSGELETVRSKVPSLDQLIAGRKNMLQAASHDIASSSLPMIIDSPTQPQIAQLQAAQASRGHSRSSSRPSNARGSPPNSKATNITPQSSTPATSSAAASQATSKQPTSDETAENQTKQPITLPASAGPDVSIFQPPPPEMPSTTDVLMQKFEFPVDAAQPGAEDGDSTNPPQMRTASLNHILTNVVVLQEFILELVAVLQVRAAVFGEKEVCTTIV
ncbi:uncharacterized protein RCC_04445 [Lecanosticta acicola]|uniref:Uncharacterized protein RCC_04445 n=1 Tax=Lecanosticta acicola TaxID=111012 RepID=A0AAI8Z4W4_9PEZI|nr:uncharacterized protein RCC_04445 [Lecanosticta acicola]